MLLLSLIKPLHVTFAVFKAIPTLFFLFMFRDHGPVAETSVGLVRGSAMISTHGRQFFSFRGVPYAQPPIEDLRFQDPVEIESWEGVFDATREGPECLQFDATTLKIKGEEDCLRLNIYTHTISPYVGKRPVMVFIHGGAWFEGSGNGESFIYGPRYFMNRDVVLVTINYRLGPLGFLSTADEFAPGNYGLLDQSMALRWIKRNIEAFGGDSSSITLFGNSAGGVSVEYHLLSPRSQGLFSKAIAQSGSTLCFWSSSTTVQVYTNLLASHLKCQKSSSQELLDCLRQRDAKDIVYFRSKLQLSRLWPIAFGPRVDVERRDPFLPRPPLEILRTGHFSKVPLIMGTNKNEGAFIVAELIAFKGKRMKKFEKHFMRNLPFVFGQEFKPNGVQKSYAAFRRYFGNLKFPSQNVHIFEQMISDASFFKCIRDSIHYHSFYNRAVYAYWYTHRDAITLPLIFGVPRVIEDLGVSHLDETLAMFNIPFISSALRDEDDIRMTEIMLDFWTSFAATGVPQSEEADDPWLPIRGGRTSYMNLRTEPVFVNSSFPFSHRLPFWDAFYNQ